MTKELSRADKILDLAEKSVFYKKGNGSGFYRISYTDMSEGYFQVLDEDSGEEYRIEPDEVVNDDVFFPTTEVEVSSIL